MPSLEIGAIWNENKPFRNAQPVLCFRAKRVNGRCIRVSLLCFKQVPLRLEYRKGSSKGACVIGDTAHTNGFCFCFRWEAERGGMHFARLRQRARESRGNGLASLFLFLYSSSFGKRCPLHARQPPSLFGDKNSLSPKRC